ncbi:MAG TPA: hypothetical protein EYH36_06060 [Desulfocapsa sulfexigens]|nr:hypothetical protein [Desulfocapsa sulfexigens]
MSKNNIIIALVVLCFLGVIWGSVKDKKSDSLERQLAAMKAEASVAAENAAAASESSDAAKKALAEAEGLKSQNMKLLKRAATLKGNLTSQKKEIASQKKEIATLKKLLAEADDGSQALEALRAQSAKEIKALQAQSAKEMKALQDQLENKSGAIVTLEEAVAAAMAEIKQKNMELAVAAKINEGLENVKATLANNVDEYNAKSQALAVEVEEYRLRVLALEKALEERDKLLVGAGEELARTKLNMNVLLSKIAAQNNSLKVLEEIRVALETELAAQVVEEAIPAEEAAPEAPAEEAPAN